MSKHKDIFQVGDHGSTFGGNFLSTRAGNEVLAILEEYKNSGALDEALVYFDDKLKALVAKFPTLFEKEVGLGLMRGIRCLDTNLLPKAISTAFEEGVLILKAGRGTLRFLPPLTISKEEIDEGFKRLNYAFEKLC